MRSESPIWVTVAGVAAFCLGTVLFCMVLVRIALGQVDPGDLLKAPCTPMLIIGPQGRPLPNAVATFTDYTGDPVTVYNDGDGTSVFTGGVPASSILQVYADAGTLIVTVTSLGFTRSYVVTCTYPMADSVRKTILDFDANAMVASATYPPANRQDATEGVPSQWNMAVDAKSRVSIDFRMPTYALTLQSFKLETYQALTSGAARWTVDWCVFANHEDTCTPDGTNAVTVNTTQTTANSRQDVTFNLNDPDWGVNDHVILWFDREGDVDTYNGSIFLRRSTFEFQKD